MEQFARELGITSKTRILDVGGTPEYWKLLSTLPRVTLLNMPRTSTELTGVLEWVAADARRLPFVDQSFDIVFSNSVIEHVGNEDNQRLFAQEVARVGRRYWVQTPNRWFPVEQHLLTPFLHWLPASWQKMIVPRWTIWGTLTSVSAEQRRFFLEDYLYAVRLLDDRDLRVLFPEARLIRERLLGFTKSFVAVK